MKTIQLIILLVLGTAVTGCGYLGRYEGAGSPLPATTPANLEISYSSTSFQYDGASFEKIIIKGLSISVETSKGSDGDKWSAAITETDKDLLYKSFLANEFTKIQPEPDKGRWATHSSTEIISIKAGDLSTSVKYEENEHPLSENDLVRFSSVKNQIVDLAKKYEKSK